jgi:hypothetical protein
MAETFINAQLATTGALLDGLAIELGQTGGNSEFAAVDAAIASQELAFDKLNALFDIGALGNNGNTSNND